MTDRSGSASDIDSAPADVRWTVNDLLLHRPDAAAVLNAFGVDTCCGGASTLAEAAVEAGVDLPALLGALDLAAGITVRRTA